MALTCGDVATGRLRAEKAVELHRELQDDWGTAFSLEAIALSQLADIAVDEGRVADAVSLLKKSHRILRELNDLDAAFAQAWERGLTMTADEGVALALDSLGAAGATAGSRSRAI